MGPANGTREASDPRVLYISYDGLLEPLGQSQILPYLERLSERRIGLSLLTYEKRSGSETKAELAELRRRLRQRGILWTSLRYHKSPTIPATLYDVFVGVIVAALLVRRHRVQIVHARSYVAALIALILKKIFGICFLFDMRGFWADERVEAGIWRPGSKVYRLVKALERAYLSKADAVISLTAAAKQEIQTFDYLRGRHPPITIIPTCVDLDRFQMKESNRSRRAGPFCNDRFTLVYSGSVGTWYRLDEMLVFFLALKKRIPDALFLVLTHGPRGLIETAANKYGLGDQDLTVHGIPFQRMPEWIAAGETGIFFSTPSWANKARCPTKLAEFLALGIPVVINRGIGDIETIVLDARVGVVVEHFGEVAYEKALLTLFDLLNDGNLKRRCRQVAEHYFSLETGALKYQEVYEAMVSARMSRRMSSVSRRGMGDRG